MKNKSGFTMIEVSLFLALSAALFIVVAVGVQNSIYQQRKNDSIQSFVEFLKSTYSEVTNVQNEGDGKSNKAIYGKLVTFGESKNLSGENNVEQTIFSYNVIGDIREDIGTGNTLDLLRILNANVLVKGSNESWSPAGIIKEYNMKWSSEIQNIVGVNNLADAKKGAILVVRHPKSGTVNTYVLEGKTVEVNDSSSNSNSNSSKLLTDNLDKFSMKQIDFCVNPYGDGGKSNLVDVRINEGAKASTAVGAFYDGEGNLCAE